MYLLIHSLLCITLQLQRTEKGRSMLLSKMGSHDNLKDENVSLTRELAEKGREVTQLQAQVSSSTSRVAQLQQDCDRLSGELVTSQVGASYGYGYFTVRILFLIGGRWGHGAAPISIITSVAA
mgnify:CR=1 FL=1